MAATHLREAYDCIVLGSGRTASQLATAMSRAGKQTLRLSRETSTLHSWLHPRRNAYSAEVADGQRLPLSSVGVTNATGKRSTTIRAATSAFPYTPPRNTSATTLTLPQGCHICCDSPQEVRLNGALPATTIRAGLVISVSNAPHLSRQSAIGGIYRDVSAGENEDRQAMLFATQRKGEVFWLVPMVGALWSIGLIRSPEGLPATETLADEFEEALVACPALTQRLIAAQLVGNLHLFAEQKSVGPLERSPEVLTLPDYQAWLDPVFSSSDWLGEELATQIAQLFLGEYGSASRLADWQQHWQAVEHLTRERIAPWYEQHEALPAALHDHAQREWYEKLLAGSELDFRSPKRYN